MPDQIPHLPIGTVIGNGKYKIIRFIAAGGFGCTYEAEFMMMNTRVAIKEFFVNSMCNRQTSGLVSIGAISQTNLVNRLEEKFVCEARNLYNLSHPNIVSVKDIFTDNGTSYYVMDYIDGKSLQSILNENGPMPEQLALNFMQQVMSALEYVHGKKMLHLDLKPDNIMIDNTGKAILIDFGVSKQYDEVDGHNTSTILGQTPGYAPIEQMGNNIASFAPSTDIYALGATFHTALTGQAPPSAVSLFSGTASLLPLPPQTSPQTRIAIEMMMQPQSTARPQNIDAVRAILAGAAQPFQPKPFPPKPFPRQPFPPQPPRPNPMQEAKSPKVSKIVFLVLACFFTFIALFVNAVMLIFALPAWILYFVYKKKEKKWKEEHNIEDD